MGPASRSRHRTAAIVTSVGGPRNWGSSGSTSLDNACQAMDYRGRLSVSAMAADGRVVVAVSDTGPGIPEDLKERMFEPFFTTKKPGEGTGLGLDIARRIAERHGGGISFSSVPGRTVFTVTLPAG